MPPTNTLSEALINGQRPAPVTALIIDPTTGAPILPGTAAERTQQTAVLLTNANATGGWVPWQGGRGSVFVDGTFGGATVALEARYNGQPHSMGPASSVNSNGVIGFELPAGCDIRATITGGTGQSLNASAVSHRTI